VVIPDHHEGYITWEEFMRNQEQIRSNAGWNARMGQNQGAARNGPALLAGLLRCGRCGRALQVTYTNSKLHGPLPRYWCSGDRSRQLVRCCITFAGTRVDQEVAAEVLDALRPVGIQSAFDALEKSLAQTDEKRRALELAVQKTRYEASRIERQYRLPSRKTGLSRPSWRSAGTTLWRKLPKWSAAWKRPPPPCRS
jgi:hypothetical protein